MANCYFGEPHGMKHCYIPFFMLLISNALLVLARHKPLRFCDDGRIEIDNNAAERALRVVALGRKNFLFAGSDGGGESAAAIYGLLGTAKLNGIDPESYLRNVLSRIASYPINRIEELLPWNVATSLPPGIDEAA
jgi:hypothetical protein